MPPLPSSTQLAYNRLVGWRYRHVKCFCLFIGFARSGHSLIGYLLTAHPEIIISHEANALGMITLGMKRHRLFNHIYKHDQYHTKRGATAGGRQRYQYKVENQWQGRHTRIKVIGDKQGGLNSGILYLFPTVLYLARRIIQKIRTVIVLRNPYDIISTRRLLSPQRSFLIVSESFFKELEGTQIALDQLHEEEKYLLRHEDFISDPTNHLSDLCAFLGVKASPDYLRDCAAIVNPTPSKTRYKVEWKPQQIARVAEEIDRFPYLKGYTFDD